ncbi:MAG TPA: hypothetical protein VFH15_04830 [Pyrinomonadaceae bacterium]|nr:hypothetical protein [Pyrinomonadaceae bacterium]
MFSFKRSLIALIRLPVIVVAVATLMPIVSRGQGDIKNPLNRDPRKSYYLTQTTHNGSQPLTACAAGYHMASLWEIHDPSNLRYDTELGLTEADSGFGPPSASGWIRTAGGPAGAIVGSGLAGRSNCLAWTVSNEEYGTLVFLPGAFWDGLNVTVVSPWRASTDRCDSSQRVWCVQD